MPLDASASAALLTGKAIPDAIGVQECGRIGDWLAVQAEWGQEHLAKSSAIAAGFPAFLPLVRERQPKTARRPARSVLRPAFAGYLFALVAPSQRWADLCACEGVAGVLHRVGDRHAPAHVPPAFMAAMLVRASQLGVLEDRSAPDLLPALAPRTPVVVTAGPFAGLDGIAERSTAERVTVLLDVMGRATPVALRRDFVREAAGGAA